MLLIIDMKSAIIPFCLLAGTQMQATATTTETESQILEQAKKENIKETRPNIILMVSDDHGMDAIGAYGNPIIKTPNLDRLASEGVRFTNAFCTSASSAASRAAILTGMYSHAIGAYGHTHDYHHFSTFDKTPSLPVLLEEAGYYTGRVGKYHLAPESVYHFNQVYKANERNTVEMAEVSKDIFNSEQPFFLYFCTGDPHRSGGPIVDGDWRTPNAFGNRVTGYEGVKTVEYSPEDVIVPNFLPDNAETRAELAQYYQSISRIDQGVGKLLKYLKKSGKADNTLIIYIADNGMAFPGAKTTVYDAGIKLPCIIKDPRSSVKNIVNDAMISWVDLCPTILDYAGVKYDPTKFQGRSFNKIINNPESEGWDKIYASHTFHEITMYYPMRVVRDRKYKLIWNAAWRLEYPFASDLFISSTWQSIKRSKSEYYGPKLVQDFLFRKEFELFDIESDPNETTNLAYDPKYNEVFEQMLNELKAWQVKNKDPWYILWSGDASLQGTGEDL